MDYITGSMTNSTVAVIIKALKLTVGFQVGWQRAAHDYQYSLHLTVPTDGNSWKYHTESVSTDGKTVFGRSKGQMNNKIGYFTVAEALASDEYNSAGNYIGNFPTK